MACEASYRPKLITKHNTKVSWDSISIKIDRLFELAKPVRYAIFRLLKASTRHRQRSPYFPFPQPNFYFPFKVPIYPLLPSAFILCQPRQGRPSNVL